MDRYKSRTTSLDAPSRIGGVLLTKSDTEPCNPRPRFCSIVGTGTLRVEITEDEVLNFSAAEVAALQGWWPVSIYRLHNNGTDASIVVRGYE